MPADPEDVEEPTTPVTALLFALEGEAMAVLAMATAEGWPPERLLAALIKLARTAVTRATLALIAAVTEAWAAGQVSADADLPDDERPPRRAPVPPGAARAMNPILRAIAGLPDRAQSVYLQAAQEAQAAGLGTRLATSADVLQRLTAQGIVGFTDKAGRSWDLVSYAEMVARTVNTQVMVDGHLARLVARGRDLVMVSDAPEECKRCRPWEGKVLSISGRYPPGQHTEDGARFTVAGTVAQARADGLFHPNCRHRLVAYLPGITRPLKDTRDPAGEALRTEQRARERRDRALQRQAIAARAFGRRSPESRAAAAKLKAHRADTNAWLARNNRKKLRNRTRLDVR